MTNDDPKKKEGCKLTALVVLFLLAAGAIVAYLVYDDMLDQRLLQATEVCDEDDEGYKTLYDTTSTSEVVNWAYNLTNPLEYLGGAEAHFHELGGYSYDVEATRANARFSDNKVKYALYTNGKFMAAQSPAGLASTDEIYSINVAYLTLLGRARHEGLLLLRATCSLTQLALIGSTAVTTICRTEEIGTSAVCQCCAVTPRANSTTCSAIASPTSKAGGLVSFLAKHDGGVKLNSAASAFPLSSGSYSALVVKKSVQNLLLGSPSSILGIFQYQLGSAFVREDISNTTADIVDACRVLDHCPTLPVLAAQLAGAGSLPGVLAILKALDCAGLVPSSQGLVDAGLDLERAMQLRYLEGASCGPYTVTLAAAALLMATSTMGSSYTCASGTLPCCLSAFNVPGLASGSGLGCLLWVPGTMITRQAYTLDEAYRYLTPSPDNELNTGCAGDGKAFQLISWAGRQAIDRWYVPSTYVYPAMPWADPMVGPVSSFSGVAGAMTVVDLTGTSVLGRKGRGASSGYLQRELTDGEPKYTHEEVSDVQGLSTKDLYFSSKSSVDGIPTNKFLYRPPSNWTAAEDEARQRVGEMPYANMQNLRFSKSIAALVSLPNWLNVDAKIFTQSSNTDKYAAAGGGVSVYHTRDGYSSDSALLAAPGLMTSASLESHRSDLLGFAEVEPASGVALNTHVNNMASTYTWNCNPLLDSTCGLLASAHDTTAPLCYIFGNGKQMPCSNANVFTPRVRGAKVLPLYWSSTKLKADSSISDSIREARDTRYVLAILSLALPLLFLVTLLVLRPALCCPCFSRAGGSAKVAAAYSSQDVKEAKEDPADDEVHPISN